MKKHKPRFNVSKNRLYSAILMLFALFSWWVVGEIGPLLFFAPLAIPLFAIKDKPVIRRVYIPYYEINHERK